MSLSRCFYFPWRCRHTEPPVLSLQRLVICHHRGCKSCHCHSSA